MRRNGGLIIATLMGGMVLAGNANAHPHVFADARLDVTVNSDGTVQKLAHVWRFDDLFSSTVLVEFDKNGDLALNDSELGELSKTINESIAEYRYFQTVLKNGKDVVMNPPKHLIADFQDNQLLIIFESEPKEPLKLDGKVSFGVYDPTFYTAIDYADDKDLQIAGLPASCKSAVIRPDADEALAANQSTLTDAFFNDPTGTDMSKIFATRLEVTCEAQK